MGPPPGSARDVGQQPFDLAVDAAQIVVGPPLDRSEHARVESEQEPLAVWHDRRCMIS